jgi:predicted amidophosphoribosyltransferase
MARAEGRPPPRGVDSLTTVLRYRGGARQLVARLKYRNARDALPWLALALADATEHIDLGVVTWVPTTTKRRRDRGFDQAELLARAVARRLDLPCRALLRRRAGPPQTGRTLAQRRDDAPRFAPRRRLPGAVPVLLVDDVVTSGATLAAAAVALREAGAGAVHAAVAASTPLKDSATRVDATVSGYSRRPPSR